MNCQFAFAFTSFPAANDEVFFESRCGELYRVRYNIKEHRDLVLHISWDLPKSVLVKAELLSDESGKFAYSTYEQVDGKSLQLKFREIFRLQDSTKLFTCIISTMSFIRSQNLLKEEQDTSRNENMTSDLVVDKKLKGLSRDISRLLISGYDSDVTVSNRNIEREAHKAILAARSTVFSEMLQNDSRNTDKIFVGVPDDVLKNLLTFIYTGVVKAWNMGNASELYSLADEYRFSDLKEACVNYFLECMSLKNVFDIYILSKASNDETLRSHAANYITSNFFKIRDTAYWDRFRQENPVFYSEITNLVQNRANTFSGHKIKRHKCL